MDANVNLDNVLPVRIKQCTETSVKRAVISVPTDNVTRMETAYQAV